MYRNNIPPGHLLLILVTIPVIASSSLSDHKNHVFNFHHHFDHNTYYESDEQQDEPLRQIDPYANESESYYDKKYLGGNLFEHEQWDDVTKDEVHELSRVLDGFVFLNNLYDALVRPGQFDSAGGPTKIRVNVELHPGFIIDEEKNEMTVTLTLTQNWTDPRLAYESRVTMPEMLPYVTLTSSMHQLDLWLPDTFIMNQKRISKLEYPGGDLIRVDPKGRVSRKQRMTVTFQCSFWDNQRFPFDSQVCAMEFSSFSWNASQVKYDVTMSECKMDIPSSNDGVFSIDSCFIKEIVFSRNEFKMGNSSGFIKYIGLERNLHHYVSKMFMPLGMFTMISIIGMMPGIEPEIGAGLSYFMFGLMSIFMSITFKGQEFSWGEERTALDSYFIYCVLTCLICGIFNLLKIHIIAKQSSSSNNPESFEMSSQNERNSNNNTRGSSWPEDNHILNEEEYSFYEEVRPRSISITSWLKVVKNNFIKLASIVTGACYRINDFWIVVVLVVFISWNLVYWAHYLHLLL